jgi:tRNA pseudouridine38-40 synthase
MGGRKMTNYKLVIEYEGTRYNGWQKQGNTDNTIQGLLEQATYRVTGENCVVNGSGRTDAGTHAYGQVANFKTDTNISTDEMLARLNKVLPNDIRILSCEKVDMRFHARLNAKAKTYIYKLYVGEKQPVFDRRTALHYNADVNVDLMKEAAAHLIGEHDFKSFCSNHRTKKSTVRTIYSIDIVKDEKYITFTYKGNGFLYNMVRILTGTLLEVGIGKRTVSSIRDTIMAKDRSKAGTTMPPRGLILAEVKY